MNRTHASFATRNTKTIRWMLEGVDRLGELPRFVAEHPACQPLYARFRYSL